jgi:RNA polymerase sigma factor (sigma-70 family)
VLLTYGVNFTSRFFGGEPAVSLENDSLKSNGPDSPPVVDDPIVENARRIRRNKRLPTAEISRLIVENIQYGETVARSMLRRWGVMMPPEQLYSIVGDSLSEAANRFDKAKGASFNTFFYYHLRGALLKEMEQLFRRKNNLVLMSELSNDEGGCPEAYLAKQTQNAVKRSDPTPEELLHEKQVAELCWDACSSLDELEQEVINRHIVEEEALTDIASELGYSRCHISRVKSKALGSLARRLKQLFNPNASKDSAGSVKTYTGGRGRRRS